VRKRLREATGRERDGDQALRTLSPRFRVEGGYIGRGYGYPTKWGDEAVRRGAALGLELDATYTGKVFAALLADADAGRLRGKRVLFIHSQSSADLGALVAAGDLAALPQWLRPRLATETDSAVEPFHDD
jgi:hypothetical protein